MQENRGGARSNHRRFMAVRRKDLIGQKFGRLTVLEDTGKRKKGRIVWLCRCDCGRETNVMGDNLSRGHTQSCGCLQAEAASRNIKEFRVQCERIKLPSYKHGDAPRGNLSRLYRIWAGMKSRCRDANNVSYNYYGQRNIGVCSKWANDYLAFKNWSLANGYQDNLVIHRIDRNGNYDPNNCRWITKSENSKNAQKERWIQRGDFAT